MKNDLDTWMEYEEKFENPDIQTIRVIGEDRKYHIAEPHRDVCLCGMKILSKKKDEVEDNNNGILYSCYECTY
jgi:hypothetical protein